MSLAKKIFSIVSIIFVILLIYFAVHIFQFLKSPMIEQGNALSIKVYPHTNIFQLTQQLQQQGVLKHPILFITWARLTGDYKKLRYGEYWIKPGMSAHQLLKNIVSGKGFVIHKITFIEGSTFKDFKNLLLKNPDLKQTLANKDDAAIMTALGSSIKNPEGLFFPDTYLFTWNTPDTDILKKSYDHMQTFLTQRTINKINQLPYQNTYQILIVASIIEKETAVAAERPLIAGVILRRLQQGMRLQMDPTVTYGLNQPYGTALSKKDLSIITPYNTYLITGLPPSPICMPGASAIMAALQPDLNHRYLFYVAHGDGTHIFSEDYQDHEVAVKKYREIEAKRTKP